MAFSSERNRARAWRTALAAAALLAACGLVRAEEPAEEVRRFPLEVKAHDDDGDALNYTWKQLSGPTDVKIDNPRSPKTWFTTTVPGEYVFEIRVSDGKDEVAKKKVWNITMPNRAPVAAFEQPVQNAVLTQKVVVDGSKSFDKDGEIKEYQWTVVSSPPNAKLKLGEKDLKSRKIYFETAEPGDYVFELKVFDGKDWSAAAQAVVKVAAINKMPILDLGEKEQKGEVGVKPPEVVKPVELGAPPKADVSKTKAGAYKVGDVITLDGSASTDPQGEELTFFWRQILDDKTPVLHTLVPDMNSAKGDKKDEFHCPVWRVKITELGVYRFKLEVSAGKGEKIRTGISDLAEFSVGGANRPPVAAFTPKGTQYEKGQTVTLDASASTDADGDKLEYFWARSGKGLWPKTWVVDNGPRVQFVADEEGDYGIRLFVSDGKDKSAPVEQLIHVSAANRPPVVDLPANIDAVVGETVRVTAKVSDPDQDPVSVEWKVLSPPSLKLPKEALSANPLVFTPPDRQIYVFSLTASDGRMASAPARVQVSVTDNAANVPPTAILKGELHYTAGQKVVIDGSESSDVGKKRLSYAWKQVPMDKEPKIPGPVPANTESKWEFTPTEPGKYQVSLVVSNGVSESRPGTQYFEVEVAKTENHAPVAAVLPAQAILVEEMILLNGAGSSDPDKDALTYTWRVVEGENLVKLGPRNQPRLAVTGVEAGKVKFELVVNDGKTDSAPATADLEIKARRSAPVAVVGGPELAKIGEAVTLSADKSTCSAGSLIEVYQWGQLADGGPPLGLIDRDLRKKDLSFKPEKSGSYVFQLVVVDDKGMRSKPATWTVTVSDASGHVDEPKVAERPKVETPKRPPDEQTAKTPDLPKPANAEPGTPMAVISDVVSCEPGGTLALDGSNSTSGTGKNIEEYRWECVSSPDGTKVGFGFLNRGKAKAKTEVELSKEGEYTFELKVYNGKQWSEPARTTVKTRPPNVPPNAAVVAIANYTDQDLNNPAALLRLPHIVKTDARSNMLTVEEGKEILLDASGSTDSDKGPKALVFRWKLLSGPSPEQKSEDGPYLRFKPGRSGTMVWDLIANDGKADSAPAQVKINVLKAGTLPVARARDYQIVTNVAVRGQQGNFIVLDGTPSVINAAAKAKAQFAWRQIGGEDLQLRPEQMAKPQVGLRIYHAGAYRFMLIIKDGDNYSLPAVVDVTVKDPSMPENANQTPKPPERPEGGALLPPPKQAKEPPARPKPPVEPDAVAAHPENTPKPPEPKAPEPKAPEPKPEEVVKTPEPPPEPKVVKNDPPPEAPKEEPKETPKEPEPPSALTGDLADPKYRADDPVFQSRKKKIEALIAKPGSEPQSQLIQSLGDKDKDLRRVAATALVQRGMGSVLDLIEVLDSGSGDAKGEAHWALMQLSKKSFGPDAASWRKWWNSQAGFP